MLYLVPHWFRSDEYKIPKWRNYYCRQKHLLWSINQMCKNRKRKMCKTLDGSWIQECGANAYTSLFKRNESCVCVCVRVCNLLFERQYKRSVQSITVLLESWNWTEFKLSLQWVGRNSNVTIITLINSKLLHAAVILMYKLQLHSFTAG